MRKSLFISDLHLHPDHPEIEQSLLAFLQQDNSDTDAIYILGDLFEFWLGDDDIETPYKEVITALQQASSRVPLFFLPGNRDFLVGVTFQADTGCKIIEDGLVFDLYGKKTMLLHGDTLCTDDIEYQRFRTEVRSDSWKDNVMAMALDERRQFFRSLRQQSQNAIREKSSHILDVNSDAVISAFKTSGIDLMIHGHTHRPGIHTYKVSDKTVRRIVLGDWFEQGSLLTCMENGEHALTSITHTWIKD